MGRTTRRSLLQAGIGLTALGVSPRAGWTATPADLDFDDMYGEVGVLGLSFSSRLKSLDGQPVRMRGFMAPPLKAEAKFFVLTQIPMSICPFCSSDADWPANIVVIYLDKKQTFEQANRRIDVDGRLEVGSWTDPETGFVSLVRLSRARFSAA